MISGQLVLVFLQSYLYVVFQKSFSNNTVFFVPVKYIAVFENGILEH